MYWILYVGTSVVKEKDHAEMYLRLYLELSAKIVNGISFDYTIMTSLTAVITGSLGLPHSWRYLHAPLQAVVASLYPLKTSENLKVFRCFLRI